MLIGGNLYAADGDLIVTNGLGVGGVPLTGVSLTLNKADGWGPTLNFINDQEGHTPNFAMFPLGQSDHFATIPGGNYDYYLFENSNVEGKNKEFRLYGYPTGADGKNYGSFQLIGTNPDFQIKATADTGSPANIILTPDNGVAIGATDPGAYKLWAEGEAWSTVGWSSTSDGRYKKNVESIDSALDRVLILRGVSYEWNTEDYKNKGFTEGKHYGVVAQEVAEVLPEVVRENTGGDMGVSYMEMIPVLIEAVKEQQKIIEKQQEEIEALKSKI